MKNLPLNVIVFSESKLQRRDPIFESISSSVRVGDKVFLVDKDSLEMDKEGSFTRLSLSQLKASVLTADGDSVLLTPSCHITKSNLDLLRRRFDEGWEIVAPRSNALPLYQRVVSPHYSGRSQMRSFQRKWEETHQGLLTSTPFVAVEGLGVKNSHLLNALSKAASLSFLDLAWAISLTMSEADISIKIDDSNYLHVSGSSDYRVSLQYQRSTDVSGAYEKVAVDQSDSNRKVVASSTDATQVLSLAMIVKNEEDNLTKAVDSVRSLVEDVVVVDTGSTDDTIAIIAQMGLEAYHFDWIDDFGAARDFALDNTGSDWVLHLDADETFEVDPTAFLAELAELVGNGVAAFANIYNHDQLELADAMSHQMIRVARRVDVRWSGMIHEQLFERCDLRSPVVGEIQSGHIDHFGYTSIGDAIKKKSDRNLRIAKQYYEMRRDAYSLIHLARTYILAGESDVAEAMLEEAVEKGQIEHLWFPVVYRLLIESKLGKSEVESAKKYVVEFGSRFPRRADQMAREALVLAKEGDISGALSVFRTLPVREVYPGDMTFYRAQIVPSIAKYVGEAGNYFEACLIMLNTMDEAGGVEVHPGLLIDYMEKANIAPMEFYRRIPQDRRVSVFGLIRQLDLIDPDLGSRFVIDLLKNGVSDLVVLVTAAEVSKFAHVALKLEISAFLRAAGMYDHCPLITSAKDLRLPIAERIASAFVAYGAFNDDRSREIAAVICDALPTDTLGAAVEIANEKYSLELPRDGSSLLLTFSDELASAR